MEVIDRILYKKVVSGDAEETNRGSQQGLLFKLKKKKKNKIKVERHEQNWNNIN